MSSSKKREKNDASYKLKAVERAENYSKEAAAREMQSESVCGAVKRTS